MWDSTAFYSFLLFLQIAVMSHIFTRAIFQKLCLQGEDFSPILPDPVAIKESWE